MKSKFKEEVTFLLLHMETQIDYILNKIETHQYPDNGGSDDALDTWGVGFTLTKNVASNIFDFHRLLERTIEKAKKQISKLSDEPAKPQLSIDYKKGMWMINFEFYNDDCQLDDRYSMIAVVSKENVKTLLTRLVEAGITILDVMGENVITNQ